MKVNDVKEKSRFWTLALRISTITVLCIGIFFIVKIFTTNPLEGKWVHQDSSLIIEVPKDKVKNDEDAELLDTLVKVSWLDENSNVRIIVGMDYTTNYEDKTITLKANEEALNTTKTEYSDKINENGLMSSIHSVEGTYEYSISMRELTLVNEEYGGVLVFDKQ